VGKKSNAYLFSLLAVLIIAGAAGYGLYHWLGLSHHDAGQSPAGTAANGAPAADAQLLGKMRPDFTLKDTQGKPRSISEWNGKVVLLNFWATWCPPCRKEMPDFVKLQETYGKRGFEVVGVAIDDPQAAQDFADQLGVTYPILAGSMDAVKVAQAYGDRFQALPYSVLIDRQGHIRLVHPGELTRAEIEPKIKALL
jgi:peroxiredoxin